MTIPFRPIILAVLAAIILLSLAACPHTPPRELRIAAASDLKFALDEIGPQFQQANAGVSVHLTYGSSGNFFAEIQNGAPYDLFLSADILLPRKLIAEGHAIVGSDFHYANGRIVLWVPNDSPIDLHQLGIKALLDPSVRKIAIANPVHAPYGAAAVAAMKHFSIYEQIAPRLVLGENVSQAAQFIDTRSAEIGIIALSLASSPKMKSGGRYWQIPLEAYPKLEQGGAIPIRARQPELARSFREFLTSPGGRATLQRYGFGAPD